MILGLTCGAGVLLFLRLVADDLAASTHLLERLERREKREADKRQRARQEQLDDNAAYDDEVPVLQAAHSIPA